MTTDRESLPDARSVEALVVKVRARLDYPELNGSPGYIDALEALDRLAELAHTARRAADERERRRQFIHEHGVDDGG